MEAYRNDMVNDGQHNKMSFQIQLNQRIETSLSNITNNNNNRHFHIMYHLRHVEINRMQF